MTETTPEAKAASIQLDSGTYEILRNRLEQSGKSLRSKIDQLNNDRKGVFGAIEFKLLSTERITTENHCIPRDMIAIGNKLIFGYNVHLGLRTETNLTDVFNIYSFENLAFSNIGLDKIKDPKFETDFKELYKYYKNTFFEKFAIIGPYLYMVFRVGKNPNDFKTFKWLISKEELKYEGNRSDHEYKFPNQFEFEWQRTSRDYHRKGAHPHVSVLDKVFIETIGGDLTIKVEDNTDTGEGIYSEEVEDKDQRLDDSEMYYADLGNIILLKIKPFKENNFRYIVYNHKIKTATRIDTIKESCVLLPDEHGIIFSNGYYLQTGEYKLFENSIQSLKFEKRIISPNGEDFLYVFYNTENGVYVLLPYNLINQKVENLIQCNGFSFFPNGELIYFQTKEEAITHHAVQIWKTPYVSIDYVTPVVSDSYLYKIGNKDIVRCMAECTEILNLLNKNDEAFSNLYLEIVKKVSGTVDGYFWLKEEAVGNIAQPLIDIKNTAVATIDEFEKVIRIKKNSQEQLKKLSENTEAIFSRIKKEKYSDINVFVEILSALRLLRGEVISLKDLRYINLETINDLEKQIAEQTELISNSCVKFLLQEKALLPYQTKISGIHEASTKIQKVTEAVEVEKQLSIVLKELEMLIEIISNLKIEDATQSAKIIDNISIHFAEINRIKSVVHNKKNDLQKTESAAEFNAQTKLLDQSITNYLDISDTSQKCDDYLAKLLLSLETIEGKFAELDDCIKVVTEKREEIYQAFENKKFQILEAKNKKVNALSSAAERILNGTVNKISTFTNASEINGYFASDLMIDKLRDIVNQLNNLGASIKADEIQGRIKTLKEDAIRQLRDRQELFLEGSDVVKFGKFHFSVNKQAVELTMIPKNSEMAFHITGTGFFEIVPDIEFQKTRVFWDQPLISENENIYRSEFLAFLIYNKSRNNEEQFAHLLSLDDAQLLNTVQQFMSLRYSEGYVKGVNDKDASLLLKALLNLHKSIDLLKFSSAARACAKFYWLYATSDQERSFLNKKLKGIGAILKVFPNTGQYGEIKNLLLKNIQKFVSDSSLFDHAITEEASEYLFWEMVRGNEFIASSEAVQLAENFKSYITKNKKQDYYFESLSMFNESPIHALEIARNWLNAYIESEKKPKSIDIIDEATLLLLSNDNAGNIIRSKVETDIQDIVGSHALINNGIYSLHYNRFILKMTKYMMEVVPQYENFLKKKNSLIDSFKQELRLDEFKAKVLSSFVRNKLIDEVYLPLVGANLAKQIGVVGEQKRTDQMGMLLLISPPGYGKTTLMEYIANKLGLIFMKINGPALGHKITSLDPSEATNAGAREELEKLNLAFELRENVMIYIDDIQHCNPEFLQKFISLCDGQRKIEGVYKGKSKTYDFRGKKLCIVMAGNPYTESGDKFEIPDMLANRADTYNLGDIIGNKEAIFKLSYIENCLTSNAILGKVAGKSLKDIYSFIQLADTGDKTGLDFESTYSVEETSDIVALIKKLKAIQEIIIKVNKAYIYSAAQADEYRVEPPFKLQGSYRNMNKLAEKVSPLMNDEELNRIIQDHYQNESQTLTTGAEANLLKFKEIAGWISEAELARWEEIKTTYRKNQRFRGLGDSGHAAQLLAQLSVLGEGVEGIKTALENKN